MQNFFRILAWSARRRATVAGVVFSSLIVALMWGVNIGALYPMVEVVFAGQSASDYIDHRLVEINVEEGKLQQEISQLSGPQLSSQQQMRKHYLESTLQKQEQSSGMLLVLKPYADSYMPKDPFSTLLAIIGVLMIGTCIKLVFVMLNMVLVEHLSLRAVFDVRTKLFRHALRLGAEDSEGLNSTPQLVARFTSDLQSVAESLSTLYGRLIREPLKMIVCFAGAAFICWRLLLLTLIVAPVAAFLTNQLSRSIKRASRRALEEMGQLYARLSETLGSLRVVSAFNRQGYERSRFRNTAFQFYRKSMRIVTYNALSRPISELLGMSMISLAILAGGYLVLNRKTELFGIPMSEQPLTFGAVMAFYGFLIGMSDPARKLTDVMTILQRGAAAADRVFEILDSEPRIVEQRKPLILPRPHQQLEFDKVSFAFGSGTPVLRDFSLKISHGEAIALVGPNGCGKSTLLNLLCRFHDPLTGQVKLDGTPISQITLRDLRKRIGLVTQRAILFEDTILNNIRYGRPGATRDQAIAAAKSASAFEFIENQTEKGFDTLIGSGGSTLSGGQAQRIALARAMLRNPDILILDEATSQIDVESEQLIHEALAKFIQGRTTIMVTHRLSTLELVDRIIFMERGQIVEQGTLKELIFRCEAFRRLFQIGAKQFAA